MLPVRAYFEPVPDQHPVFSITDFQNTEEEKLDAWMYPEDPNQPKGGITKTILPPYTHTM